MRHNVEQFLFVTETKPLICLNAMEIAVYKLIRFLQQYWANATIFTALHGMQTRSSDSDCLSVRLSVSPSVKRVDCDKTEENQPIFLHLRKII